MPDWFTVGPMLLVLEDGATVDVLQGTRIKTVCDEIPVPDVVGGVGPCIVLAVTSNGEAEVVELLIDGRDVDAGAWMLHSTGITRAFEDRIVVDVFELMVDADVAVECAQFETLRDVVGAPVAGVVIALRPSDGVVVGVRCSFLIDEL